MALRCYIAILKAIGKEFGFPPWLDRGIKNAIVSDVYKLQR